MTTTRTATTTTHTGATAEPLTAEPLAPVGAGRSRSRQRGQLTLLPGRAAAPGSAGRGPWHLDERTRRVGRAGVAEARATLQAARQRELAGNGGDTRAA